jgi:phage terminase large subunit-like protein
MSNSFVKPVDKCSKAEIVADLPSEKRKLIFKDLTDEQIDALTYDANFWLRPAQMIPDGTWFITALICGRGWGKTRAISEWVRRKALEHPGCRIGIAGKNAGDVRDVIVEGPSGILAVHHPDERPEYRSSIRRIEWKNGSVATLLSSESPDQGRGPGYHYAVLDEFAAWKEIRDDSGATLFTNLIAATRLGQYPQLILATTPKRTATMRKLLADADEKPHKYIVIHGKTTDNRSLSSAYVENFQDQYKDNPDLYRQELLGLMIEDSEGLVFTQAMIEDNRLAVTNPPSIKEYPLRVVSVDPTVAAEPRDECGIIVIASTVDRKPSDRRAVILDDQSLKAGPDGPHGWAQRVVDTAEMWKTKFIVVEKNQGHDLVRMAIHAIDPTLIIFPVVATKGKLVRAEPVVIALQQRRVKFWGVFAELEDQMNFYDPAQKGSSPDRMDAMVWGIISTIITPPAGMYTARASVSKVTGTIPTNSRAGMSAARSHTLESRY